MRGSLILLLTAGVACSNTMAPKPSTGLAAARSVWDHAEPQNYRFAVRYECFCAIFPHSAIVDVRQGSIQSVLDANTGAPAAQVAGIRTIPGIFDQIAHAVRTGADVVRVAYDPALGFPREVFLDYSRSAIDDEIRIVIEDFVLLD